MGNPVHSRPGSIASPVIACLTAPTAPDPGARLPNRPTESHRPGPRLSSPAYCPADPAPAPLPRTAIGAPNDNQRPPPAPFIGIERGPSRPTALTPCSNPKAAPHRWIRAKQATQATVSRIFPKRVAVNYAKLRGHWPKRGLQLGPAGCDVEPDRDRVSGGSRSSEPSQGIPKEKPLRRGPAGGWTRPQQGALVSGRQVCGGIA